MSIKKFVLTTALVFLSIATIAIILLKQQLPGLPGISKKPSSQTLILSKFDKFIKFKSDDEFTKYVSQNSQKTMFNKSISSPDTTRLEAQTALEGERVSQTNVQVLGIDEPDIVKTDGDNLYLSLDRSINRIMPLMEDQFGRGKILPPEAEKGSQIVKAFPPKDLKESATINKKGDLLLSKESLVIFDYEGIYGYDVSDPKDPQKKWQIKYENNTQKVQARLYKNKIYLVTRTGFGKFTPCLIKPFSVNNESINIKCVDIYHPVVNSDIDSTYVVSVINPKDGKVEKSLSFVAGASDAVIYMSKNSLYISYAYNVDLVEFYYGFVKDNTDFFNSEVIAKLEKLRSYDISQQAKLIELENILSKYNSGQSDDNGLKNETELQNRGQKYIQLHKRELERTGIVKVDVGNLQIAALGSVPGKPLNQFSFDEYNNNLRVATTVTNNTWLSGFGSVRNESANDVYTLDNSLRQIGSVLDLGKTEKIYSVRFIGSRAYVVTFRQTDPFYVLDLSNPRDPKLKGELKIPGYSSYLHPLTKDLILGVGMENSNVKLSLFDVSDPQNPLEIDKYNLSEYWSDILNTHHAFLADETKQIFFIPGSKGGYIFSYKNNKLSLVKTVASSGQAKRAIYINNYLYIITDSKIAVLDENTWEKVNELQF